jgi:GT2 family glycosyltransferase
MREALAEPVDWFLWLDADVVGLPSDLIQRLLEAESKIVVPDCVLEPGGPSYDLNAFLEVGTPTVATYYRHCRYGLFQPPARYWERRHLDDLRYLHRTPLHGVGGTALFVHGDVHRAGLGFPEIPYRDLLETEAFGILARDCGVVPMGLPRVTVIHARV